MRYQGRITSWKEDRGFGFITPSQGGDQVFVHISSFINRSRSPIENEAVTYKLRTDKQGRPQAGEVSFIGDRAPVVRAAMFAAFFLVIVAGFAVVGRLPPTVPALYLIASAIAFGAYAWDKLAAQNDQRRTAESTLHLLGLLGGWPGALVARQLFRHKTQKRSFIVSFWGTVILNCSAVVWLLSPPGQRLVASLLKILEG